jgi:hypothetical protein
MIYKLENLRAKILQWKYHLIISFLWYISSYKESNFQIFHIINIYLMDILALEKGKFINFINIIFIFMNKIIKYFWLLINFNYLKYSQINWRDR